VPEYKNSEDVECLYSGLVPSECEMMDSIIYMQSQFCEYVYMFNKKYSDLLKKECTHEVSLSEKQIKIDDQQKQILDLSYQIEKLRMEKQKLEIVKADELEMLKKELYSLRNFMFSMQNTEYENSLGGCDNYKGTYDEVVIVGGHNTWHTKLVHNFEGINIVNTDQNVVNWKFLARMKVVVIVTNYISHSMYYRVMEKITNQELIYVSYRNLDHLKKEIDTVLMMIKK
jgi:hypothetical protein